MGQHGFKSCFAHGAAEAATGHVRLVDAVEFMHIGQRVAGLGMWWEGMDARNFD